MVSSFTALTFSDNGQWQAASAELERRLPALLAVHGPDLVALTLSAATPLRSGNQMIPNISPKEIWYIYNHFEIQQFQQIYNSLMQNPLLFSGNNSAQQSPTVQSGKYKNKPWQTNPKQI